MKIKHVCCLSFVAAAMSSFVQSGYAQTVAVTILPRAEGKADAVLARPVTVRLDRMPLGQAIEALASKANVRAAYQAQIIGAIQKSITLHATRMSLRAALDSILAGTNLQVQTAAPNFVIIEPMAAEVAFGGITGRVTSGQNKQALRGAAVLVDGAPTKIVTGDDGTYRIANLSPGTHVLTFKCIGYGRQKREVTVREQENVTLDVVMESSANQLDQVVVTGTVVATELRAVPNAITVITAKQLEDRGVTRIDQLFRGDVPGLFSMNRGSESALDGVIMYSRGTSSIGRSSARGSRDNTNAIKTYVDGIELSNPQYLSQIDPRSIERIEILSGPQASTIYGSNALNGVMQIFTKRGKTSAPQMTLELLNGWVQSNFSDALTPYHDYTGQLNGVDGRVSYNGGGNWNYMGPWTPSKQTTRMGAFGGVRFAMPTVAGAVTSDFSYRRTLTRNRRVGRDDQTIGYYKETGWWAGAANDFGNQHVVSTLKGETVGLTLGYTPLSWWSHELTVGQDNSYEERQELGSFRSPRDTSGLFFQPKVQRRSLRYATTVQIPMRELARITMTAGGDSWQDLYDWISGPRTTSLTAGRVTSHNAGGFLQAQLGVFEHLFLTYGLRAEWNPVFGKEAMPAYSPRYGATYTTDLGPITAKVRASYGRSTRPPQLGQKMASRSYDNEQIAVYGPFDEQIANPVLGPEHQQGGEGGVELYFGGRASLVITRYNQTVDGLVTRILGADSIRSLKPDPIFFGFATCATAIEWRAPFICSSQDADGFGYRWVYQNVNAASIRNQGWELQGSTMLGPMTVRGTYSWTKSRIIGVTPQYREQLQGDAFLARTYKPGATFALLPEHTGAMGFTYARARTLASLNMTWTGALRSDISEFKNKYLEGSLRLRENKLIDTGQGHDAYVVVNPGYAQMDLMMSHRILPRAEMLLQIQNLTDQYSNDYRAWYTTMGRQSKVGIRLR